ncbi:MAG: homoserine O-succinyltransferase, partial [Clostridia bacterium]|nr:homoserine O-succinyltransferase [Clostridia bacterium]
NTSQEHMIAFYKTFDQIRQKYYDGMIITGAPVELMEFEEVEYWDELCEIMEWSKSHVHSTFHICWGAQAALYYHYGIRKYRMPKKLSGVYAHTLEYKTGMLFRGFDDLFYVPHSRNTEVRREDVEACPELKVICTSEKAGLFAVKSVDDRQIFIMGHSEYDPDTLKKEYERDVRAGIDPEIPEHYFPNDDPSKPPLVTWRSCANLLYSNWLNYFVYQSTPYDIEQIREEVKEKLEVGETNVIAAKFGGSSLADADCFRNVDAILKEDPRRRYAVVSAPGKRDKDDRKVTDLLLMAVETDDRQAAEAALGAVEARFAEIAAGLGSGLDIAAEFREIREKLFYEDSRAYRAWIHDYVASRGEYLTARLMAEVTGWDFLDAAELIRFDDRGKYDEAASMPLMKTALAAHERAVIPGFYGCRPDGQIETFSRGGSDITGGIVAAAARADLYENWTDVSGLLLADPTVVKNPAPVPLLTYRELRELAYLGAQVMHPDAVFPVDKLQIPMQIRNTLRPQDAGTLVVTNARYYSGKLDISGISGKTGYIAVTVDKAGVNEDAWLRGQVLTAFNEAGVAVSSILASIDSLTLIAARDSFRERSYFGGERSAIEPVLERIERTLASRIGETTVYSNGNVAVIGIVGRELGSSPTIAIKVLSALSERHIGIKLIDHGTDKMHMTVAVDEEDYENAVRAIYDRFA